MQRPDFSMNRLIQGDVGSGKTAVAAALCYCVAKSNMQAVFMAPTEILAQQHYKSFQKLFKKCEGKHVNIEILTGSISMKKRREVLCFLEKGLIDILIGTHALLSESVIFKNLGLVITDEQHRFGVLQRANLAAKGNNPHVLVMSATPIPRTLALIIYGDLDISLLDEKPPGRQKIETIFIKTEKKGRMFEFLKKLIDEGKQGYIVCPVIEKSETSLIAAKEYFNKLKKEDFMNYNIALLHVKMKAEEKATVMGSFAKGEISVLVSTTVIEVGLDISNAVFMVIENAERFGFSQLHQLRGRVGRGNAKSYCILISDAQNKKAVKRLEIMTSTDDGFKIADEDLKIRGPGEFLGERQHGLPDLKILKFSEDIEIFKKTQKLAKKIFEQDPDLSRLEHRFLRSQMRRMFERSFRSFI
jgi:ATP-dependent DNA helicase RecG